LRQGCQRLDRIQHRGKKRPTLMTPGREAVEHGFRVGMTIRRSGHGGRETSSPPIHAARSLRLCGESPLRKWRERVGNTRGAGARSSIGWQTSVGRIARLLRREVARPVGDKRALARRRSVAPPDAGHGWVEGETVRVCAGSSKDSECMVFRFRLGDSRYDERRSRADARQALTGETKQKSSGS